MAKKLSGIIPPMVTPATADGLSVDCEKLRNLTRWLIASGVDGLFIGATAGEYAMLDRAQRQTAVETVVSEVTGRMPVIAGASGLSTAISIQAAKDAQEAGADYVMVLPPGIFPNPDDAMVRHFANVADAITIPTLLYNFPAISHDHVITPAILAEVTKRANVVGVKDSSGDLSNTRGYRLACGEEVSLLLGADRLVYPHLMLGGDGTICAGLNVAPKAYVALYKAFLDGDLQRSLALQDALWNIPSLCVVGTFPSGLKYGAKQFGVDVGPPFLPSMPLEGENAARADKLIADMAAACAHLGVDLGPLSS